MASEQLNPFAVEVFAAILGAFNPKAEQNYRLSLEVIDTNPMLCNWLQLSSFALVGIEITKNYRRPRR